MLDPFGREINYMRISVTDRCNLRCVYCMPLEGVQLRPREEYLTFEEIERVVRAGLALGIDRIRITGGEPTVRPGLVEFIARIKEAGVRDISMTTNGILFPKMAADLKRAGLNRVNISLDTLRPERFKAIARLFDDPQVVLDAVEAALELELHPVKLNMVVMRGWNDDEIVEMARMTLDRPIHLRYIEVMPFSEAYPFSEEVLVPAAEIRQRLMAEFGDLEPLKEGVPGNGPARYWRIPGAKGTVGFISAMTECFCAGCNRIRLSADGKINPCLGHIHEYDLKPVLRDPSATEEDLIRAIEAAILRKPREHNFDDPNGEYTLRVMHGIGG
ncbi:MAG: GTP 3',8-cyclase MoaA [Firmicutes bacterium]|nr:GTP 3',8-cyclase MoaA [Bacillota bacterium]